MLRHHRRLAAATFLVITVMLLVPVSRIRIESDFLPGEAGRGDCWIAALGVLAIGMVLVGYFRRWSCMIICLLPPMIAVAVALAAFGLAAVELPSILPYCGAVVCGLLAACPIQWMVAYQRQPAPSGDRNEDAGLRAAKDTIGSATMSLAATVSGLAAFAASTSAAPRKLAVFMIIALVSAWAITYLVLTALPSRWLVRKTAVALRTEPHLAHSRSTRVAAASLLIGSTCWFGWHALHLRFDIDAPIREGRHPAVVLLRDEIAQSLHEKQRRIEAMLLAQREDGMIESFGPADDRQTKDASILSLAVHMRPDLSPRLATGWAQELRLRFPDLTILCNDLSVLQAADRIRAQAESAVPVLLLAMILPMWLCLGRISLAMAAAASLVPCLVWMLGAAEAFFRGVDALQIMSVLLFAIPFALDSGIRRVRKIPPLRAARILSALVVIIGALTLIIARHSMVRELGVTLAAGIACTSLFAAFVAPSITRWLHRSPAPGRLPVTLRAIGRLGLIVILLLLAIPPACEWLLSREVPLGVQRVPDAPLVQTGNAAWRVGDSWMRRRDGIWEISCGGTPEEIGYAVGKLGAPVNVRIENEMFEQLDTLLPNVWSRWIVTRAVGLSLISLPHFIPPALQREVYAAAHSYDDPHAYVAPTYPRLLGYHALHDVSQMLVDNPLLAERSAGCTGVIARPEFSGDGHLWLARNFDFEGGETFGRHKSITYYRPKEGLALVSVAWPAVAGCVTGMNEQRLAVFMNAAATRDFRRIGTPTIIMLRQVLQYAQSLDEAVAIIRSTSVFVSDIIVLADGKTGKAVVVEKNPADTAVWEVGDSAVVANHCVSPRFRDDPVNLARMSSGTTVQRFERASELLHRLRGKISQPALAALLRDKRGLGDKDIGLGNRNAIDALIACHSVIMDVTAGRLWVAAWPHAEGSFVYVDVLSMLRDPAESNSPDTSMNGPADPVMTDGGWDRFRRSRSACARASQALAAGRASVAAAEAMQAISANPNFYYGHELLGRALLLQGKTVAARTALERSLSLDPPYAARRDAIAALIRQCNKPAAPTSAPSEGPDAGAH